MREVVHLLEREARQVDGEVAHDDDDVRLDDSAQHLDACGEYNVASIMWWVVRARRGGVGRGLMRPRRALPMKPSHVVDGEWGGMG